MNYTGEFLRMLESWKLGEEGFDQRILLRQEELETELRRRAGTWEAHGLWSFREERIV